MTDANLITGRIVPEMLPETFGPKRNKALDMDAARESFLKLKDCKKIVRYCLYSVFFVTFNSNSPIRANM